MDDILADIIARQPNYIYQNYLSEYQYKMKLASIKKDVKVIDERIIDLKKLDKKIQKSLFD